MGIEYLPFSTFNSNTSNVHLWGILLGGRQYCGQSSQVPRPLHFRVISLSPQAITYSFCTPKYAHAIARLQSWCWFCHLTTIDQLALSIHARWHRISTLAVFSLIVGVVGIRGRLQESSESPLLAPEPLISSVCAELRCSIARSMREPTTTNRNFIVTSR